MLPKRDHINKRANVDEVLKILQLEDNAFDAGMIRYELKKGGVQFNYQLVDNKNDFISAIQDFSPDIILSDHTLPAFDSRAALAIVSSLSYKIPFILITGTVSEEYAVEIMKKGATDYILKTSLQRLPSAVLNAVEKFRIEAESQNYLDELIFNEALLNESEKLAHLGSWQENLETGLVKWSDETYRIYGVEPGKMEPTPVRFLDYVHPDDLQYVSEMTADAMIELHDEIKFNFRIIDAGGRLKRLQSELKVERNSEGKPLKITGFNLDITEVHNAQEALRNSEANLKTLFDNTWISYLLLDADLNIVTFNKAAANRLINAAGKRVEEHKPFMDYITEYNKKAAEKIYKRVLKGDFKEYESTFAAKSGDTLWYNVQLSPVMNENNDALGMIVAMTDITEKKKAAQEREKLTSDLQKSDAHLRTIFDNTEIGYLLLDKELNILSFNNLADKEFILEFEKGLEKGECIIDYMPEDRKEQVREDYNKVLEGEHSNYESNFLTGKGKLMWYNFQLSPVISNQNKILGMVIAISDITKKKSAEIEKEKLSEALKESHLGLKKLVARAQTAREEERLHIAREVHDELGQILTSTKIELSMVKKKFSLTKENVTLQADFDYILKLIDKSIKSVKKIATDLRPEMLDEIGLIESIKWQAEEFQKNTGVAYTLSISEDFTDLAHDINRSTTLYRIVQEALTNIARHANATKVKIAIKTSIDNIFLIIQDNGVGITEEQKSKKKSFGLVGLRERVLLLNGIIDFSGQPKGGTVVYVQIPYFI